jgi:protein involved in polysaccharide export with SLBB domain
MSLATSRLAALALQLSATVVVHSALAQSQSGQPTPEITRAQLTVRARVADSLGHKDEAFALRTRLRDGDFEVGDRILAKYEGPGLTKDDTLIVQAGRVLRLGEPLGDVSVSGVLRFEVQALITARVDRLYKNEVVHVTPLIRLSISGAVRTPGTYHVRSDVQLSDVIMRNGSVDQTADLRNVTIRRGTQILWASADVQSALSNGLTVEGLNLEPGDEIVVGVRTQNRWLIAAQFGVPVVTSILLALLFRNHR